MNHQNLTAAGLAMIGLVASAAISFFTLRRLEPDAKRHEAARWLFVFGLFLCTFLGATALVGAGQTWFLLAPLVGVGVALDALHRIGLTSSSGEVRPSGEARSDARV